MMSLDLSSVFSESSLTVTPSVSTTSRGGAGGAGTGRGAAAGGRTTGRGAPVMGAIGVAWATADGAVRGAAEGRPGSGGFTVPPGRAAGAIGRLVSAGACLAGASRAVFSGRRFSVLWTAFAAGACGFSSAGGAGLGTVFLAGAAGAVGFTLFAGIGGAGSAFGKGEAFAPDSAVLNAPRFCRILSTHSSSMLLRLDLTSTPFARSRSTASSLEIGRAS